MRFTILRKAGTKGAGVSVAFAVAIVIAWVWISLMAVRQMRGLKGANG
jgi:hypothetical protein